MAAPGNLTIVSSVRAAAREWLVLAGEFERLLVSESGHYLVVGWLGDQGGDAPRLAMGWGEEAVEIPGEAVLRHARDDIGSRTGESPHDHGFIAFGRCDSPDWLRRPVLIVACSAFQLLARVVTPELVADGHLLDSLLIRAATARMHAGTEATLHRFLAGAAGAAVVALFGDQVARNTARYHVQRFGRRPVSRSFVTVLFGTTDAVLLQPALFQDAGIPLGEWVYVCNSPEDAATVLRLGQVVSDLHDVMVTVVVLGGNGGFGAANNVGVAEASSEDIVLINPDVFPVPTHTGPLARFIDGRAFGDSLWGGLLFYDEATLMHGGMYIEADACLGRAACGGGRAPAPPPVDLLRVEHIAKGIPFDAARWASPRGVQAVSGAAMAFRRGAFARLGGFSTRYVYGHYEDADLSLRWAEAGGAVVVDPDFRMIHLEGQGSRSGGQQHRAAAVVNRHLFTLRHGADRAGAPTAPGSAA